MPKGLRAGGLGPEAQSPEAAHSGPLGLESGVHGIWNGFDPHPWVSRTCVGSNEFSDVFLEFIDAGRRSNIKDSVIGKCSIAVGRFGHLRSEAAGRWVSMI